jgi:DNA-binding MarR family transcriptional regulator
MDSESQRDLQLLEALEQQSAITQRTLSARLGIALGLTNLYVKRLVRKGYVKCVTISPNRLVYLVTPQGLAVKARLTYEFMKFSLDYYRDVRRHLRESLAAGVNRQQRVAVYGTGDVAELVFLLLKEMGLELVVVFDDRAGRFLDMPVQSLADQDAAAYDILIVAVLEKPGAARKRLLAAGVPPGKVLMLRASTTAAKRPASAASAARR